MGRLPKPFAPRGPVAGTVELVKPQKTQQVVIRRTTRGKIGLTIPSDSIMLAAFALTTDRSKHSARDQRGVIDITGLRLPKREYAARQEA